MSKKRRKKPSIRKEGDGNIENQQAKVVKTSANKTARRKPAPRSKTTVKSKKVSPTYSEKDMIFGRENYIMMIAGLVIIFIGFLLMRGGQMPDANTWDNSIIYSTRRITIAPILILLGLIVEIWAIFRKPKVEETPALGVKTAE
jgi:hypothetical protein